MSIDTTEELYPFMVPEDEEGFTWHIEYMTKEEIITTLEANDRRSNRVSELVIENNRQYVTEFSPDVKTYKDASVPSFEFVISVFLGAIALVSLFAFIDSVIFDRW